MELTEQALRKHLSDGIRRLRKDFIKARQAASFYQITNELSREFASQLEFSLQELPGNALWAVSNGNFMLDEDRWDLLLMVQDWNIDEPAGIDWVGLHQIRFGEHTWVACGKRHYDAECPDGVESFFDLPHFRRYIVDHLRSTGVECADVETDDVIPVPTHPPLRKVA
ncbi:hypothetical protein F6X40_10245 [Paraburkholderia sp. UCT31]|uniref:hypothetical protein n=1 Tax=Paraburkholderia sp. UCT31 TaxID=2615209 RepID=UPI0016561B20|nr:hypothetical protein [Paraburkholderia sp. UCT31]MBC8737188.1 hypothetical protein [Paraburkholderia sp. UCT31]